MVEQCASTDDRNQTSRAAKALLPGLALRAIEDSFSPSRIFHHIRQADP
jgi:hypothetical protein